MSRVFSVVKNEDGSVKFPGTKLPVYATKKSAGADFFCAEAIEIPSIWREDGRGLNPTLVHTGTSCSMEDDDVLLLFNRSSGPKRGLVLANSVGVVDADYSGEIMFAFYNFSRETVRIEAGERIGQGMFTSYHSADNAEVLEVTRKAGGFGSTGI